MLEDENLNQHFTKKVTNIRDMLINEADPDYNMTKSMLKQEAKRQSNKKKRRSLRKSIKKLSTHFNFEVNRDTDSDQIFSGGSLTTSVSPGSRLERSYSPCKTEYDQIPRSFSFHNINETAPSHINDCDTANCYICLKLCDLKSGEKCLKHLKSQSWVRKQNDEFKLHLAYTVTSNAWDDPFEPKHVYKEP